MKSLPRLRPAHVLLLGLVALLLFGNCSQNVYRVLGPGTTPQQVSQLRELERTTRQAYREADKRPAGAPGPTGRQLADSAQAQRTRLLTPAQNSRYRQHVFPLRYPRHPPRGYR